MEIYLVFSKTGTWLSRVLRVILKKKYVHVSLSFDDRLNYMYSFGRVNPNNPFSGGFVIEDLRKGVYRRSREAECIVYKLKISDDQYQQMKYKLQDFEKNKQNLKYNFIGLFAVLLNVQLKRRNKYFCSQFVSELFIDSRIINNSKPAEVFRPEDFIISINNLEPIFEGNVKDYVMEYDRIDLWGDKIKYIYFYDTIIGKIGLVATNDYLIKICFSENKEDYTGLETPLIKETYYQIKEYLSGERLEFNLPFKFLEGTEWEKRVWSTVKNIPYGQAKTYQEIATLVGRPKGYRAVGNALNKNPLPILIPCHRVIKATGEIGGYGGGIIIKEKLLCLEKSIINK